MIRYAFFCLLSSICFLSTSMDDQIDNISKQEYKVKWKEVNIESKEFDFHKSYAEKLVKNKVFLGIEDKSNLAIIGLSIHSGETTRYVVYPNMIYGKYNITEDDAPLIDLDGVKVNSIYDMMCTNVKGEKPKVQRVLDFLDYLFPCEYTSKWNLYKGILHCRHIIGWDRDKMYRIPQMASIDQVLHCVQVFLYRALESNEIFDDMINTLFAKEENVDLLRSSNSYITLDIMTYNDMCPKCFSTCVHKLEKLSHKINQAIIRKTKNLENFSSFFTARSGKPFNVNVLISSFKPYPTARTTIGKGYHLYSNANYANEMTEITGLEKIYQFFNPWIAQNMFFMEFNNFLESLKSLNNNEYPNIYIINELLEKGRQLYNNKEFESEMDQKILNTFLEYEKLILSNEKLSFNILPLAIEIFNRTILFYKHPYQEFIQRLINNFLSSIEEKASFADTLNIIPNIVNQNEILHTAMLIQSSIPDALECYDFQAMRNSAEKINLNNVHPLIVKFIKFKVKQIIESFSSKFIPDEVNAKLNEILEQ